MEQVSWALLMARIQQLEAWGAELKAQSQRPRGAPKNCSNSSDFSRAEPQTQGRRPAAAAVRAQ
jgi:hypothetical protein